MHIPMTTLLRFRNIISSRWQARPHPGSQQALKPCSSAFKPYSIEKSIALLIASPVFLWNQRLCLFDKASLKTGSPGASVTAQCLNPSTSRAIASSIRSAGGPNMLCKCAGPSLEQQTVMLMATSTEDYGKARAMATDAVQSRAYLYPIKVQ